MIPGQPMPAALSSSHLARLLSPYQHPIQHHYDEKGRHQSQFSESALQRRERVAFLKKRECARRVAIWMQQTGFVDSQTPPRRDHPSKTTTSSWQQTYDQYDPENEPYIIYTSAPLARSSLQAPVHLAPTTPLHTPPTRIPPRSAQTRVSPRWVHRRTISLSSISEMPEED